MTLQDLVTTLKGDRTYEQLEEATHGVVKAQRWNQIANGIRVREFPKPVTIEAMASVLGCDIEVLLLAFARAVGMDVRRRQSSFIDMLPPSVDKLSDRQQSFIISAIRAMNDDGGDDENPPGRRKAKSNSVRLRDLSAHPDRLL
jgi:hypothetical protein